jgi:hypothetical protein
MHVRELDVLLRAVVFSRRAVFGASPRRALMAADVCERARSSSSWPMSVSETITTAASK